MINQSIPSIEGVQDPQVVRILNPLKQIVEIITGRAPNRKKITKLGPDATLAGVINKVNEVIDRLQE